MGMALELAQEREERKGKRPCGERLQRGHASTGEAEWSTPGRKDAKRGASWLDEVAPVGECLRWRLKQ